MYSLLEDQLSTIQLLQAMYPLPSELVLSDSTASYVSSTSDDPAVPVPKAELDAFELTISLRIKDDPNTLLDVLIVLPVLESGEGEGGVEAGGGRAVVRPRQPGWMTRAGYEALISGTSLRLMTDEEGSSEYILDQLDAISAAASEILAESASGSAEDGGANDRPVVADTDRLERVWFWFPSLSSKEKRRDLVTYAEDSGLTGFVLAGKPGLLCVEGDGREVDRYMSRIKSESWSDIPPHQKKVTERLRRPLPDPTHRKFSDMQDITDRIPHYGQYAHRGEMGEVRRLMDEWGVGEDFGAVVMNAGT